MQMKLTVGFLEKIDKFKDAVDSKYTGLAAKKYKSDADWCVEKLKEKMGIE